MENQEKIDQLERAMELIEDANYLVENAIRDSSFYPHYEAYGKYGFNQLLGNGNPYDGSLVKLIEELKK